MASSSFQNDGRCCVKVEKERVRYRQGYRKAWEEVSEFRGWLTSVDDDSNRAYCRYCRRSLHAHRLSLMKHVTALKHLKNAIQFKENSEDESYAEIEGRVVQQEHQLTQQVLEVPKSSNLTQEVKYTSTSANVKEQVHQLKQEIAKRESFKKAHIKFKQVSVSPQQLKSEDESEVEQYFAVIEDQSDPTKEFLKFNAKPENITCEDDSPEHWIEMEVEEELEESVKEVEDEEVEEEDIETTHDINPLEHKRATISTHILDTTRGLPAAAIQVKLLRLVDNKWAGICVGFTDIDGRFDQFMENTDMVEGLYKIHFDVDKYFASTRTRSIYPFIEVVFEVSNVNESYHIPLLLNPFGYSTYRGS